MSEQETIITVANLRIPEEMLRAAIRALYKTLGEESLHERLNKAAELFRKAMLSRDPEMSEDKARDIVTKVVSEQQYGLCVTEKKRKDQGETPGRCSFCGLEHWPFEYHFTGEWVLLDKD